MKTDYRLQKPDLKRHYPEQWGRFLDNHYDPQMHRRPFCVAMQTPIHKYKYSKGVGLSFKFQNNQVLERLDIEKQTPDTLKFVRFEEFSQVKEGEVMVSIEHCVNCHKHNTSTKHDEHKYKTFANNLQGAIREQFPLVKVIIKPISTDEDQKIKRFKVDQVQDKPTIIDNQIKNLRLGAFEVQVIKKERGRFVEKVIHSKLQNGFWPNISQILERIHYYLPRVPRFTVQLYKDGNGQNRNDSEIESTIPNFKDLQVTLKSTYNGTTSQVQLDHYLEAEESTRMQVSILKKNRKMIEQTRQRPGSAKQHVAINPNVLFYSHGKQNNRNLQSIQSMALMRPASASTYFQPNHQKSTDSGIASFYNMPQRQENYMQRPISAISAKTDMPRIPRPFSAISRKSGNSTMTNAKKHVNHQEKIEGLPKKGRGLGFFGDYDDRIKEFKKQQEGEKRLNEKEHQVKTDSNGKCTLPSFLIGLYTIEVSGNEEFLPSRRDINILNDEDKDEVVIYVGMKPRIDSSIEFSLMSKGPSAQATKLKSEGVNVKAILLPGSSNIDTEEYEYDILFDSDKGLWTADLFNGSYIINVKAPGHTEVNTYAQIKHGVRSFQIICPQKGTANVTLFIKAVNIQTGKLVPGVLMQIFKSNTQQPDESVTDQKGLASFIIREISTVVVTSQRTGFANLARKFDITQGLLLASNNREIHITIPMVRDLPDDQVSAYAVLSYVGSSKAHKLKAISCSDDEIQVKNYEEFNMQVCQFDTTLMSSNTIFDESVVENKKEARSHANPAIRFVMKVVVPDLLEVKPQMMDTLFKNQLQDSNLQMSLIYRDNSGNGQFYMRTFDAPSYVNPANTVWDICFFSYPYIIETNMMIQHEPVKADQHFSYFTKLSVFLKNRKGTKFNEILGFDNDGVFRMDDTWLNPEIFANSLSSELIGIDSQKLWTYEQKKIFQRYNLKKETEDKVIAIHEDIAMFYNQFTASMMNVFGKVSYKRFNEFLHRL